MFSITGKKKNLSEWRENMIMEDTVEHIKVNRIDAEFMVSALGIYKRPLNLRAKPRVSFVGELGQDESALTREFFSQGMEGLRGKVDGMVLFEGEVGHHDQ